MNGCNRSLEPSQLCLFPGKDKLMDENLKGTLRTILGLILAAIALAAGFMLYHKGHASADSGDLAGLGFGILAISLLLTGAVIIAFPVAHWLSRPAGKLFYAGEEFDRPQPMYSVFEGKRKSGHYRRRLTGFNRSPANIRRKLRPTSR